MPRQFALFRDHAGDPCAIRAESITSVSIGWEDDKRTGFIEVYVSETDEDGYFEVIGEFAEIVAEIEGCLAGRESWQD